jgi:Fur family ferric uptake transcriptional regulator
MSDVDLSADLHAALKEQGLRLTDARRAIIAALVSTRSHLSADELADIVREREPGTGRMTVYRTLELLSAMGLIRPVYMGSGAARYVLLNQGHHHHLVCSLCHKVIEFDACDLEELEAFVRGRFQFEGAGHLLEIYGRCPDCGAAETADGERL